MIKIDVYDNAESAGRVFQSYYNLIRGKLPFSDRDIAAGIESIFKEEYGLELQNLRTNEEFPKQSITEGYVEKLKQYKVINAGCAGSTLNKLKVSEKKKLFQTFVRNLINAYSEDLYRTLYDAKGMIISNNLGRLLCGYMDDKEIKRLIESEAIREDKADKQISEDLLSFVFPYEKISKEQDLIYRFVETIGLNACPYCNRNYVSVVREDNNTGGSHFKTRPQLDHFWNKKDYPFLAVSMRNLVPSCGVCNLAKLDKPSSKLLYPYKEGLGDQYRFSIETKKSIGYITNLYAEPADIKLVIKKDWQAETTSCADEKFNGSKEMFGWDKTYEIDKAYALRVFHNSVIFGEEYQDALIEAMPEMFKSREDVRRILNPKLIPEENFNKETLSKLTHDIAKQAQKLVGGG